MIRRRNTTDSSNGSWPLCKYYYTHNTGSCDDILLHRKETIRRCGKKKPLSKRFTYPISLRDQKLLQLNKKEKSSQIKRRWSSSVRQKSKKRNTLAGIVCSLTRKDTLLPGERTNDKRLDEKWESIRWYQDTEKVEQEEGEAGPSTATANNTTITTTTTTTTNTTMEVLTPTTTVVDTRGDNSTTLMNSSIRTNSPLIANAPSSSAGQETVITMDEPQQQQQQQEEVSQVVQQPEKKKSSQKEKLLFLFGFLMFPLWWIGAWQYVIQQQDHKRVSRDREVFQILNCLMSLASLLLVGLMIGLTTVWA